jgi:uncharacterized protein GlcG (DUF336 family)
MKRNLFKLISISLISILLASCSSGGSSNGGQDGGCDGGCAKQSLTASDVSLILRQGISEATLRGLSANLAVLDRVGNVLAVYKMPGASINTKIDGQIGASGGLEGASVPATLAAISKAGTGAFLSSQGNAFTSRTASQIIQEHFNPGERGQPGGPLFGVQFSQLPCSDVFRSGSGIKPLPLGLSADPGGIPLYKNGDVVGGIGVELDGLYGLDRNISDRDQNTEEAIALSAAFGFEAPQSRRADSIVVGGKSLRFTDEQYPSSSPLDLQNVELSSSGFVNVPGFGGGSIRGGTQFGTAASGVLDTVRAGVPAAILATQGESTRPGSALAGGVQLTASEVRAILDSALVTSYRARAAIRNPLDSPARVSIWVVDTNGTPLGFIRSQDAPVFGIDVSLQKARTAAFFSSASASSRLSGAASNAASFFGQPVFGKAISARAIGNMARPFFTDGIDGNPNGPLSLPFPGSGSGRSWSPFNTGLQLDLVAGGIVGGLSGGRSGNCTGVSGLANGIQIFPGAVPLYRNGTLIGAIGVSGDGIDQDDLTAFYGASRKGLDFIGHTSIGDPVLGFNAPNSIRSDTIQSPFGNSTLRYVNCPEAPFIQDNEQNVCEN